MVSALLRHGPGYLREVREEMARRMEEYGYGSLREMRGCMSLRHCPDPKAYERANYMKILQSWQA
jgi:dihydroorotate dehydrogenase (fumarate)